MNGHYVYPIVYFSVFSVHTGDILPLWTLKDTIMDTIQVSYYTYSGHYGQMNYPIVYV